MRAPFVAKDVAAFFAQPDSVVLRTEVASWLDLMKSGNRYETVSLFDEEANVRIVLPERGGLPDARMRERVKAALQRNDVFLSDLYASEDGNGIHLDLFAPIFAPGEQPAGDSRPTATSSRRPVAVILLQMDPREFLYPLIQTWPMPSATAETLLVRREGDEILYLNELRHRAGTALKLRRSVQEQQLPAAIGLRGETGVREGIDYRGMPVLAVARSIPDKSWLIVAKVDQAEIYAPLRRQAWTVGLVVTALLLAAATGVGMFWRQQTAQYLNHELAVERERQALAARLALVMRHANDIILLIDKDWRIVEANDRAIEAYGYTLDELRQQTMVSIRPPETRGDFPAQSSQLLAEGSVVFETLHQRKDGTTFPVEVSSRLVRLENASYRLSIVRDITQRRAHEREIERMNRLYAALSQVNQALVRVTGRQELFDEVCRVMVEYGGFRLAWIGEHDAARQAVQPRASAGDEQGKRYLQELHISTEANAAAQGPTGAAIREERGHVCNDYTTDPYIVDSWREAARRAGFNAAAAFPIRSQGVVWGNLTVYATEAGFFRDKEIALLEETAADISFALDRLDALTRHMRALEVLQAREADLARTQAIAHLGNWSWDIASDLVTWSDELYRIYGVTPATFDRKMASVLELIHPDDRTLGREVLDRVARGENVESWENRIRRPDGGERVVLIQGASLERDASGLPRRFFGVVSDITERKEAEMALRESEAQFRRVVDAAPEAILIHKEGLVVYANPAAARLYGADSATQLVGQPMLDRVHPYFRESAQERIRLLTEERQTVPAVEQVHLRLDGQPVYLYVAAVPFVHEGKNGALVFAADFTERHRTEEALRLSQLKFETIFRSALDLNFISDLDSGEIVEASDAFCDALGSRETVLGRTMDDLHLWVSAEEQANYRKSLLSDSGKVHNFAARLRLGSGEQREFLLSGQNLFFESKEYVLTIGRDITELRQSERERTLLTNALASSLNEIYLFDAETWRFVFVNDAALHNLGYDLAQMHWMTPLDLTPDVDRAAFEQSIGPLVRHEKPGLVLETRHRRADGSFYPVEVHVQLFESESGRVFLAVVQDITERKRADEALRESQALYHSFIEQLPNAAFRKDREGRYVMVNSQFCRLKGLKAEDLLGKKSAEVAAAARVRQGEQGPATKYSEEGDVVHEQIMRTGQIVETEEEYLAANGTKQHLHVVRMPVLGSDGKVIGSQGIQFDITERREAIERVQGLVHEQRTILNTVTLGISFIKDRKLQWINPAFGVIFGYEPEEVDGMEIRPLYANQEDYDQIGTEGYARLATGRGYSREVLMQKKDGTKIWCSVTGQAIDPHDLDQGSIWVIHDITERKLAEQKLQESEYFLRKSQEVSHLGSYNYNIPTDAWTSSPTLDEIFGIDEKYPRTANGWLELVVAEQRQEMDQYLKQRVVAERNRFEKEYRIVRFNDRQVRWVFGLGELEFDDQGRTLRMIGTIQDITESKAAAIALRNAKEFAENLIRTANTMIVWLDTNGRIMLFNEAAEQVTGYARTELEGRNWFDVLVPRNRYPQAWTDFARLLNDGQPMNSDHPVLTKAGEERFVAWQSSGVYEEGRIVGTISFGMDVTDRRRAEEGIRRLNAELEHRVRDRTAELEATNNELEAFSYSVSHDLRAPLRAIDGFTRILVEDHAKALDPEGRRVLDVISKEGQRMGQLIDDLLSFSRLGRRALQPVEVDLATLARQIYTELEEHVPKRRLKLRLTPLPLAHADPSLLRQVLVNLLDNAVKYTRHRKVGEIQFGGAVQGSENVYYIKDNGAGFDMQYADKLFGVFQRLHSDEEFEGTGVGLALVQRIIRRHGGRVWAEGKVDEGATFFFTLPVHKE
ncbi:MAG TPA: PAS domain S-box protein [Opitutaceae bacterium]|nr:PAS domain S-box protein [Opitutaceae bacterium]